MNTATVHFFSQFVYLNPPPDGRDAITVGDTAYFYRRTELGQRLLEKRFGGIPEEYALWKEYLDSMPEELRDWRLTDILDDNAPSRSGFYGCAFLSPGGERVVAFRGSEMLGNPRYKNDYITDFALILCEKTPQQAMVDLYWSKYADTPGELWVTGHSLGGNLAAYGAMAAPAALRARIKGALCFNAPGFCREFIEGYQAALDDLGGRLTLYQNRYDIVSSLLDNAVPPVIVASRFDPSRAEEPTIGDVMYPHSNFMFQTDDGGEPLPEPTGRKSPLCGLAHSFSDMVLELPLAVRRELTVLTLDALYEAPDPKSGKRDALAAAGRYLGKQLSGNSRRSPAAVTYAARMLQGQDPAAFLARLHEEPPLLGGLARILLLLLHLIRPAAGGYV